MSKADVNSRFQQPPRRLGETHRHAGSQPIATRLVFLDVASTPQQTAVCVAYHALARSADVSQCATVAATAPFATGRIGERRPRVVEQR